MNVLPTDAIFNTVIFGFFIVILLGFSGLLIAIYSFLSKWIGFLQQEKSAGVDEIKQDAYKQATQILDEARAKSLKIIEEANAKTNEIVGNVAELTEDTKQNISKALQELAGKQAEVMTSTSKELADFYRDAITKQKTDSLAALEDVSEDIEKEMNEEVEVFRDVLHKETVESQELVQKKLDEEYKKVEEEIGKFRDEQLADVQNSIYQILHDVSEKVFGKVISMEDHQDIVLKALEDAKKDNVFPGN